MATNQQWKGDKQYSTFTVYDGNYIVDKNIGSLKSAIDTVRIWKEETGDDYTIKNDFTGEEVYNSEDH